MEDNELMLLVRGGNKEAYEILMKKYLPQAKAFACRYVHEQSPELSEEEQGAANEQF